MAKQQARWHGCPRAEPGRLFGESVVAPSQSSDTAEHVLQRSHELRRRQLLQLS